MARVTVLMPAYNAEEYVAEAVESMLNQSFTDFELLIIDDGSTDSTAKVVRSFEDPRINLVERDHMGLIDTMNFGVREASAPLIARMDADDTSRSDRLALQVAFLDTHPEVSVVSSWYQNVHADGSSKESPDGSPSWVYRLPLLDTDIRRIMFLWNTMAHGAAMYRRDAVVAVGGYDPEMAAVEDWDLWFRIDGRLANIPEPLINYRANPDSFSRMRPNRDDEFRARMWAVKRPSLPLAIARSVLTERRYGLRWYLEHSAYVERERWRRRRGALAHPVRPGE